MDTQSEIICSNILKSKGVPHTKIPRSKVEKVQTPDFAVDLCGIDSVWEVKELTENPDENKILKTLESENPPLYSVNSSRVKNRIKEACNQFKSYGSTDKACVVALYDARCFAVRDVLFPQFIISAMFGNAEYWKPKDGPSREIKRTGKLLQKNKKNYISAIAVLNEKSNDIIFLHNPFANISLLNLQTPFTKHLKFIFTENGLSYEWV